LSSNPQSTSFAFCNDPYALLPQKMIAHFKPVVWRKKKLEGNSSLHNRTGLAHGDFKDPAAYPAETRNRKLVEA